MRAGVKRKCVVYALTVLIALFLSGCGEQPDIDVKQVSLVFNYGDIDGAELDVFSADGTVKEYIVRPTTGSGVDLFGGEIPTEDQCEMKEYTISPEDWDSIVNAVKESNFMKLSEELPKVEAYDGSTRYLEIVTSEGTHRVGGYCAGNGAGKEHQRFAAILEALRGVTLNDTIHL